jgi:hypothetical protein
MAGFGSIASTVNAGLIIHSDVCQSAPPYLRMRALKVSMCRKVANVAIVRQHVASCVSSTYETLMSKLHCSRTRLRLSLVVAH